MNPRAATLSAIAPAGEKPFVACAGLVASDFLTRIAFPVPENVKVRVNRLARQGGGPAANAAVGLVRLGLRVSFLGAVGDDALGRAQLEELALEGVDVTGGVVVAGATSFVSFILVDEANGDRTIFSAPEDRPLLPARTRLPEPAPHLLLIDGWTGEAGEALCAEANERGVPVLLDAGTYTEDVVALLPRVDVAIVSTPFAEGIAGGGGPEAAVPLIAARGPKLVAVTRGTAGVVAGVRGGEEVFSLPAAPAEVVDSTGAGDAFHAGAAWGLVRGRTWEESLRDASCVAALQCTRLGARAGLPDAARVRSFRAGLTG